MFVNSEALKLSLGERWARDLQPPDTHTALIEVLVYLRTSDYASRFPLQSDCEVVITLETALQIAQKSAEASIDHYLY
jgi:hypothetical protein